MNSGCFFATQLCNGSADTLGMNRTPSGIRGIRYSPAVIKWLLLGCVLSTACTKPNPALSCEDGLCSDPTVPFCDVTGAIGGEPNACVHVTCSPSEVAECRGDKALTCNATGDNY